MGQEVFKSCNFKNFPTFLRQMFQEKTTIIPQGLKKLKVLIYPATKSNDKKVDKNITSFNFNQQAFIHHLHFT